MILTPVEIARFLQTAGFRGEAIGYGVAICLAESGGNTEAVSGVVSDGTRGYGLAQIETENLHGGNWRDPTWQANTFWRMSAQGTNFNPWCTACSPMPGIDKTGCGNAGSGNAVHFLFAGRSAMLVVSAEPVAVVPPVPEKKEEDMFIAKVGVDGPRWLCFPDKTRVKIDPGDLDQFRSRFGDAIILSQTALDNWRANVA
jgi:hypothetical protein